MTTPLPGPVVVLVDHATDGAVRPPVLELLTLGRRLGAVHGAWVGEAEPAAGELERLAEHGLTVLHRLPAGGADLRLPPVVAGALADLLTDVGASLLLVTSSFENKEICAHLGVLTGAGVVVDGWGLDTDEAGRVVVDKTVFAGTWTTRCAIRTPLAVAGLKANAARPEPLEVPAGPVEVRERPAAAAPAVPTAAVEEPTDRPPSGRPGLGEAQVVVVGGRGTEGDFSAVEELADVLGGAVGATRVATDEGWIAHEAQIGQTGVTVAPRLYIGAGVSGAVHHRGGMQASGTIVAVNADPEAPIFEIADLGIVGDLHTVLPQASAELRRLREG